MLQHLKNIIAVILAFFIFTVGNGVNLVEYCCNQCGNQGIEVLYDDHCNQLHHPGAHSHHVDDASCCSHHDANENLSCNEHKCQLTRYDLDQGSELPTHNKTLQITVLAVLNHFCLIPVINEPAIYLNNYSSSGFVDYSGRSILNNICVLII